MSNTPLPEEGWVLGHKVEILFFAILQCEWRKNGSGVLEIPSSSFEVGSIPPEGLRPSGGIDPTSQDLEGIFQYPLSIFTPFYHCNKGKNKTVVSRHLGIHRYPVT